MLGLYLLPARNKGQQQEEEAYLSLDEGKQPIGH